MSDAEVITQPDGELEAVPDPEELNLQEIIPALVARAGKSRPLDKIIADKMRGEEYFDQRRALKRAIQRRIATQDGNSGSELLCRAILRQLDFHYNNDIEGVEVAHKDEVVEELGVNIARCLLVCAGLILQYPASLARLQHAKEDRDPREMAKARTTSILLGDTIRKALINVGRAAVGDDVELER